MSKKTAKIIVVSGANYILGVKRNQHDLYEMTKDSFEYKLNDPYELHNNPLAVYSNIEKGHGRIVRRTVFVDYDIDWYDRIEDFAGIKCFAMITRRCEEKGKTTTENHYYIASSPFTPKQIYEYTAKEWGVETLHWSLDNTLGEDCSSIHSRSKLINANIVKKIALNFIKIFTESNEIITNCVGNSISSVMKFLSFNSKKLLN